MEKIRKTEGLAECFANAARNGRTQDGKEFLSLSLGPRIDGISIRDLIGGGDSNARRPGYSLFIEPGMTFNHGRHTFWVNVPVRLHQDFKRSLADMEHNRRGGGDLAKYLFLMGYSVRF